MEHLAHIIGQEPAKRRIRAMLDYTLERGGDFPHLLFLDACQCEAVGNLALGIANELGVPFAQTSGHLLRIKGEIIATMTNLGSGAVLLVEDLHKLPRQLAEFMAEVVQTGKLGFMIGEGLSRRTHTIPLQPFSLIASVPSLSACPEILRRLFLENIALVPYSDKEIQSIIMHEALESCIAIESEAAAIVARRCGGTPSRAVAMTKLLAKTGGILTVASVEAFWGAETCPDPSAEWDTLSGVEFEQAVASWLRTEGFDVQTTRASGDGGVDIVARLDKPLVGGRFIIQCKRLQKGSIVGEPTVRDLFGALMADSSAVKAILITTSKFSAQARAFAEANGIELIDGATLARLRGHSAPKGGSIAPSIFEWE